MKASICCVLALMGMAGEGIAAENNSSLAPLATQSTYAADRNAEAAAFVLLDNALDLSEVGDNHNRQYQRHKQWAALHEKLTRERLLSSSQMKMYLFLVFVAEQGPIIDSLEEIDKEILSIYENQPIDMLQILKKTPFLLPAVCKQLGGHFEQIDDLAGKPIFIEKNKPIFHDQLGDKLAATCLEEFK